MKYSQLKREGDHHEYYRYWTRYSKTDFPPFKIPSNLKNFLAWFAFEWVAYQLVSELEPWLV